MVSAPPEGHVCGVNLYIPLATGTHFIKSGLPVRPVFPFRAVYSSKTCTLRRFTQFMQFMQTEQFMQFMRFVLVYHKTGPDRSRPVLEQTAYNNLNGPVRSFRAVYAVYTVRIKNTYKQVEPVGPPSLARFMQFVQRPVRTGPAWSLHEVK